MTKTFNQTTSTKFETPVTIEKRSRSLISLRRRHWSASSNRSSSVSSTNRTSRTNSSINPKNRFVNCDTRSVPRSQMSRIKLNKSDTSDSFLIPDKCEIFGGNLNAPPDQSVRSCRMKVSKTNPNIKHSTEGHDLNKTSVSTFASLSRLSKNLRKSFTDVYTFGGRSNENENERKLRLKKNESTLVNNQECKDKENLQKNQAHVTPKYARRLRTFKNRLIQTKNNLFNIKKKKLNEDGKDEGATHTMPELNKIDLNDEDENDDDDDDDDDLGNADDLIMNEGHNPQSVDNNEKSFVSCVKSKLNYLKRQRITRNYKEERCSNLNNTPAKSKRAKFY